jgi:hypothetical protein
MIMNKNDPVVREFLARQKYPGMGAPKPQDAGLLPSYLGGGGQPTMFPQAMPGQLEAIASQLSAGYGPPASAYMQQMNALYNPIQVGPAPAPPPAPAPAAPQPVANTATSPAAGFAGNMLGLWGQRTGTRMSRGNR